MQKETVDGVIATEDAREKQMQESIKENAKGIENNKAELERQEEESLLRDNIIYRFYLVLKKDVQKLKKTQKEQAAGLSDQAEKINHLE